MPLIAIEKFTESDVVNNEKCFFIYAENEKKEGGSEFLRACTNTLYLTIKSVASNDREAYWSDVDYRQHVEVLSEDISRIQNIYELTDRTFSKWDIYHFPNFLNLYHNIHILLYRPIQ